MRPAPASRGQQGSDDEEEEEEEDGEEEESEEEEQQGGSGEVSWVAGWLGVGCMVYTAACSVETAGSERAKKPTVSLKLCVLITSVALRPLWLPRRRTLTWTCRTLSSTTPYCRMGECSTSTSWTTTATPGAES